MLKVEGVDPNLVHALGASLGAHVAAVFGYYMGGRISRLTGKVIGQSLITGVYILAPSLNFTPT